MHLLVDGLNKVKEGRMNNIDLFGQGWNRAAGPWLTHCGVYRIALTAKNVGRAHIDEQLQCRPKHHPALERSWRRRVTSPVRPVTSEMASLKSRVQGSTVRSDTFTNRYEVIDRQRDPEPGAEWFGPLRRVAMHSCGLHRGRTRPRDHWREPVTYVFQAASLEGNLSVPCPLRS